LLHPPKLLGRHHDHPQGGRGGHGRGAALRLEQADLAEEVARAELGNAQAVLANLGGAVLDHEELMGEPSLGGQVLPGRHLDLEGPPGELRKLVFRQACERTDPFERLDVHAVSIYERADERLVPAATLAASGEDERQYREHDQQQADS
jgi:hypothetical protein